jgi:hypothetical protein
MLQTEAFEAMPRSSSAEGKRSCLKHRPIQDERGL